MTFHHTHNLVRQLLTLLVIVALLVGGTACGQSSVDPPAIKSTQDAAVETESGDRKPPSAWNPESPISSREKTSLAESTTALAMSENDLDTDLADDVNGLATAFDQTEADAQEQTEIEIEKAIKERASQAEQSLKDQQNSIEEQLKEANQQAADALDKELEKAADAFDAQLRKVTKQIDKNLNKEAEKAFEEIDSAIEQEESKVKSTFNSVDTGLGIKSAADVIETPQSLTKDSFGEITEEEIPEAKS